MGVTNDTSAEVYDIVSRVLKPIELTEAEIQLITSNASKTDLILDVCSGTGRHLIPLLRLGYKVDGIDISSGMLAILENNLEGVSAYKPQIFNTDFLNFKSKKEYQFVYLFWNALNEICLTEKDLERFFEVVFKLLNKSGKILINIDDSTKINPAHFDFTFETAEKNLIYKVEWSTKSFNELTSTSVSTEKITVTNSVGEVVKTYSSEITQRWWSKQEIENAVKKFGFRVEERQIKNTEELYLLLCF